MGETSHGALIVFQLSCKTSPIGLVLAPSALESYSAPPPVLDVLRLPVNLIRSRVFTPLSSSISFLMTFFGLLHLSASCLLLCFWTPLLLVPARCLSSLRPSWYLGLCPFPCCLCSIPSSFHGSVPRGRLGRVPLSSWISLASSLLPFCPFFLILPCLVLSLTTCPRLRCRLFSVLLRCSS